MRPAITTINHKGSKYNAI